jgi:hypothetical protein
MASMTVVLALVLLGAQRESSDALGPVIELDGRLREIFAVSGCEQISGLTCRIQYNGRAPLPTSVFFTEFDAHGRRLGKRTRLIYPHLKAGESGMATFRIKSSGPARIRLEAVGKGPWRDPY